MAIFEVPNAFTLQGVVDAALAAGNASHSIHLTTSPVFTAARVTIGPPPPGDALFYRLLPGGSLHVPSAKWGVTVSNGASHPADVAVELDIELDIRPSGSPEHTDRGADQIRH